MTPKEKRIDMALKDLKNESKRCQNLYKTHIKEGLLLRAYEDQTYVSTINWVVDTIEYWLEEGKAP